MVCSEGMQHALNCDMMYFTLLCIYHSSFLQNQVWCSFEALYFNILYLYMLLVNLIVLPLWIRTLLLLLLYERQLLIQYSENMSILKWTFQNFCEMLTKYSLDTICIVTSHDILKYPIPLWLWYPSLERNTLMLLAKRNIQILCSCSRWKHFFKIS